MENENTFPVGPLQCSKCSSKVTYLRGGGIQKSSEDGKWVIYEDNTVYDCPICGEVSSIFFKGPACFLDVDAGIIKAPYIPESIR